MQTQTLEKKSVAPSSSHGHFIADHEQVIDLDLVNETFHVKTGGKPTRMETENHTTLNIQRDCLVTCQMVYNPFSEMFNRSVD